MVHRQFQPGELLFKQFADAGQQIKVFSSAAAGCNVGGAAGCHQDVSSNRPEKIAVPHTLAWFAFSPIHHGKFLFPAVAKSDG
jgi:hypothetical protein